MPELLHYAGVDEAGRGCLAGPVVAAVCILKPNIQKHVLLRDSKTLDEGQRLEMRKWVEENSLAWAIGYATPQEIDAINILQATFLAMHRAIEVITQKIEVSGLLIDGNRFKPYPWIPHDCIVKGDSKVPAISAASILAKTERDFMLAELSKEFPEYGWDRNKGYPTPEHKSVLKKLGHTPYHRKSFKF